METPLGETPDDGDQAGLTQLARHLDKSRALMGQWSKRWNWSTRVFDYDVYIEHLSRKSLEKKRIEMAERHADVSQVLISEATKALAKLQTSTDDLTPEQLLRFLEVGIKNERLSRGEPSEIMADTTAQDKKVVVEFIRPKESLDNGDETGG